MAAMSLTEALKEWETRNGIPLAEATDIRICGGLPFNEGHTRKFVSGLDVSLGMLASCERLSLSTNQIDRMFPFSGMPRLKILSLGRNKLKKLEKLDDVAPTLTQLWASYNQISTVDGVLCLSNLEVLYMSNNAIKDWSEIEKLSALPKLGEVLFKGNPIYDGLSEEEARLNVIKRLPQVMYVDAKLVTSEDRARAAAL